MAITDRDSLQRLNALGIEVWVRRDQTRGSRLAGSDGIAQSDDQGLRIRLASASGEWLLVQSRPWDGSHATLLADITSVIGTERCRFGQWARSASAGLALGELPDQGIRHVLAFGPLPGGCSERAFPSVPTLDELARSGRARKRLWQVLSSLLDH